MQTYCFYRTELLCKIPVCKCIFGSNQTCQNWIYSAKVHSTLKNTFWTFNQTLINIIVFGIPFSCYRVSFLHLSNRYSLIKKGKATYNFSYSLKGLNAESNRGVMIDFQIKHSKCAKYWCQFVFWLGTLVFCEQV